MFKRLCEYDYIRIYSNKYSSNLLWWQRAILFLAIVEMKWYQIDQWWKGDGNLVTLRNVFTIFITLFLLIFSCIMNLKFFLL